ncbi:MAG: hypothetical protein BMS9Abin01_0670 [Gammaproteobacteria bacterium]|nr:MAG: hypothetical protein BMS9Abin01_0670 [Gammaproteobacteria bacterium]
MQNPDLVRRIQTGHGLLLGDDAAFTFVQVAKLVDTVALGTTVNAEALHDDLNQLAGRVATASDEGNRPDATEASQALMRVEVAADRLLESLGGAEPDPVLARIFDRDSIQAVLRIRFAARRAQSGAAAAGPDSQRQMTQWLISQLKIIYRSHFHLEPEEADSAGGRKASKPFARFARFVLDRLGIDLNAKTVAS